ncbi:MAG: methyltransferase [Dinoroseobacter sp.]|nr:methyltransferase [Dinoroseobacter sp.]
MTLDIDLTCDGFLGGRLRIWQPKDGFRASTDAVLLAASVPSKPGQTALDLGCGVGTAGLCLAYRTQACVSGLELDPATARLAQRNGSANGLPLSIHTGDVAQMPASLRAESFDHVLCNPPYYAAGGGTSAHNPTRETALREKLPLQIWLDAATRRVKPGGTVSFILAADRLPDLMAAMDDRLGSGKVLPLAPRIGRPAKRVIFQAQKAARGPFILLAPFILHDGETHGEDTPDETPLARSILRDGTGLPL